MRKILILLLIYFGALTHVDAQKYKDIFPQIVGANDDLVFDILNSFLETEIDHPNANLRMAKIYIDRYKNTDLLRDYERAIALAEQAKFKLIKAKVTIDDKVIKKNEEYYAGILSDGQFSFPAISAYIDTETAAVEMFLAKAPPIYREFTRSVEKYDQAVKSFARIVGTHSSLKELYLLYNDDLHQQLAELAADYDSTKYYFDNYLALRKDYDVNAVKQTYDEEPIKVYRLDGLVTQINFLQPNIRLWDYSSWVDSVNSVVEINIVNLRKELQANDAKLKEALKRANSIQNPDSFEITKVDKALIFNLMKYDYKNALVPLLAYQEFKQELIKDQKRNVYFDTANITTDRKLAYFSDMMFASRKGDSIINEFNVRFDPEQLERHRVFVQQAYGGTEQMKSYMVDEKKAINTLFLEQVSSTKSGILAKSPADTSGIEVKFKRAVLPAFIVPQPIDSLPPEYLKTRFVLRSADETVYLAGHQINEPKINNIEIGVAKLTSDNKPLWFTTLDMEIDSAGVDANHYLGDAKLTPEGIVIIVRSVALDSSKVINTLVHFTSSGELKFAKRIPITSYPRELVFIENSNLFLLSFFGEQENVNAAEENSLSVLAFNGLGEEIWHYDNTFNGNYVSMFTTQNSVLIGGNYARIKNEAGRPFSASAGTNAYLLKLSLTGTLERIKCYASDRPYTIDTFYKVSDRNINLIGMNDEHIIVDGALEKLYSSLALKE